MIGNCSVFADVLDLCVRNIWELEAETGPLLTTIGARHWLKHSSSGFHPAHLQVTLLPVSTSSLPPPPAPLEEASEGDWRC